MAGWKKEKKVELKTRGLHRDRSGGVTFYFFDSLHVLHLLPQALHLRLAGDH